MQKLIYIEEKEGEEKVRKKNQTQKLLINLVLWQCCLSAVDFLFLSCSTQNFLPRCYNNKTQQNLKIK